MCIRDRCGHIGYSGTPAGAAVGDPGHYGKMCIRDSLTTEAFHAVMSEEKPNQKEKIVLRGDRVRQLIPKNIPVSQTEDFVCKALEYYNKFLRNRAAVSYTHLDVYKRQVIHQNIRRWKKSKRIELKKMRKS